MGSVIFPRPRTTAGKTKTAQMRKSPTGECAFKTKNKLRLLTLCDVKVEEIAVKNGLHDARHHSDLVEEAFCVVAPHPVGYVESSVEPKEEQIVGGDRLRLSGLCDHEELRHYGH